jgi:type IV pilus assembly protein PilM
VTIFGKIQLGPQTGGRPPVAVELSPQGVLAAALPGRDQSPVYAFEPLAPGALVPSIADKNLLAPEAVAAAIHTALGQVPGRSHSITLVIPDTVVRVFILDFDSLPPRATEALPVLRFRLRKMIPFEVEHAGLSYQILKETKTECKVLAAVIPGSILQEYESVARMAGYEPGAVLPSSLAAIGAVDSEDPVMAANLSATTVTTTITDGQDLLLYRTLDLPDDPAQRLDEVQRGVAVAAAYYEDKLGVRPNLLYFAGIGAGIGTGRNSAAEDFASWIEDPELMVADLAPRPETGAATPLSNLLTLAGVTGALAGTN